ncbi:MAG: hypothetical protein M1G31_08740 [Pseudanabaena sp. Salubria-1]|jgi:hypothetical protein|nr:hypothetical protein [Pseudanabaena sp. Salubria-1]
MILITLTKNTGKIELIGIFRAKQISEMNTKLIESITQIIFSLSKDEQALLKEKLFLELSEPSTEELMKLAQMGESLNFLHNEPDLYTLEDGEPV